MTMTSITQLTRIRQRRQNAVREIIGRSVLAGQFWSKLSDSKTVDETTPDYEFYDKLRRGEAKGYRLGGLFAKAISQIITSWVIGSTGPQAALVDTRAAPESGVEDDFMYTNGLIARLMKRLKSLLITFVEDEYSLGDQYIIVNPDGSFSIPSPDTVEVVRDALDYRKIIKATIKNVFADVEIQDEYREDGRTIWIKRKGESEPERIDYENLIGRIPVVHFANDRGTNETNGRPIYAPMLRLFGRYDDLAEKALDGAELMGNPIPVLEGLDDVDETLADNATTDETYLNADGTEQSRPQIRFDRLSVLLLGIGASFKFASPNSGFTNDIVGMLKVLFLLILDFTRIPEVIWGNELSSGRASAREQMLTFYSYIEGRRLALEGDGADDELTYQAKGGLLELVDIWLRMRSLVDRRVVVGAVSIKWPTLSEANEEFHLKWTEFAHDRGLIRDETALAQADLVEDAADEVEKAKAENETDLDKAVNEAFTGDQKQEDADTDLEDNTDPALLEAA